MRSLLQICHNIKFKKGEEEMRAVPNTPNQNDEKSLPSLPQPPPHHVLKDLGAMILCLGNTLTELVQEIRHDPRNCSPLYCNTKPKVSIPEYLKSSFLSISQDWQNMHIAAQQSLQLQ